MDKDKDDTRRLADLHLQAQIPVLAQRITMLEQVFRDKFDNGINAQFDKIFNKINELQCGVHSEQIKNVRENTLTDLNRMRNMIYGIYGAFTFVTVLGIAIGVWLKITLQALSKGG